MQLGFGFFGLLYSLLGERIKLKRRVLTLSGRQEKEFNLERKIKNRLDNAPYIVSEFYYSLIGSGKTYDTAYAYINYVL